MKADWDRYNQPVVEILQKNNHKAALKDCLYPSRTATDVGEHNLRTAYIERDRQLKELRELAKAVLDNTTAFKKFGPVGALRAALQEKK